MGKTIRVTGKVVEYQGAPEIIVNKPEMIVVVGQ
jgi:DNA/RNA endonuclease YhcR with UshA esterase domain